MISSPKDNTRKNTRTLWKHFEANVKLRFKGATPRFVHLMHVKLRGPFFVVRDNRLHN